MSRARSIELSARSPHSLPRIRDAFDDEAYWRFRLRAFEAGAPTLDALSTDPSGGTAVAMTMRFGGEQLPDPLRRLRLASLTVVQRERWSPAEDGTLRGAIEVDALRTPISGHGSVHLTPADAGTQLAGNAEVDVRIPLIGGAISTFIAGLLAHGIVDVVRVTDAWLAESP